MVQTGKLAAFSSVACLLLAACAESDSNPGKIETKEINGVKVTAGQGAIPEHVSNPPAELAAKKENQPVEAQMHKSEPPSAPAAPQAGAPSAPAAAAPGDSIPAAPPKPAPKLTLKEKEWNFGTVIEGDECKHAFEFKNEGPGELVLTNVQPSCGCTAKKVTIFDEKGGETDYALGTPIPAGISGKVEAILNTQNIHGTKQSRITVVSNDPVTPSLALAVQAMVEQFYQIDPPNVYQGQIFGKAGAEATIKITCLKADEFEVTGYEKIPEGLELEFTRPDPEKRNYGEIKVKFKAGLPEGPFNQQIVATTKIPGQEKPRPIRFIITGQVVGSFQVPQHMGAGLIMRGKSQTIKGTIQNRDPKMVLEVKDVEIDSPQKEFLSVALKEEMKGQTFVIELTFGEKCPPGVVKGTISFKTNQAEKPEGKISFSGVVR